jgi:hypothetical protein
MEIIKLAATGRSLQARTASARTAGGSLLVALHGGGTRQRTSRQPTATSTRPPRGRASGCAAITRGAAGGEPRSTPRRRCSMRRSCPCPDPPAGRLLRPPAVEGNHSVPTNRRSFLARSAAIVAVPSVAALAGSTLAGRASAAILPDHAPVLPPGLPLTNRHLTEREKANLAVVLQAYHDGEGDSLDPQGFMELFAADGVLNGIGDVVAQQSFEGALLSGLIVYQADLLPDIHRALKKISVSGDVVCIQLTIQGTFLGPLQTPAARSSRRGPRSPSRPPTSGICATARSRCSTATLLSPPCTRSSAYCRTTRPHSASNASFHVPRRPRTSGNKNCTHGVPVVRTDHRVGPDTPHWDLARWPEARRRLSDEPLDGLSRPSSGTGSGKAWTGSA